MFKFFKNGRKTQESENSAERKLEETARGMAGENASPLETALAMHLAERARESLGRFLIVFGNSDIWLLRPPEGKEPAVTQGPDGNAYVATFTNAERATAAAGAWGIPHLPALVPAIELVYSLSDSVGILLNANESDLRWEFTPQHVTNLRTLFEDTFNFTEGTIFSILAQGKHAAAKILKTDERGVHIRVFANTWAERPGTIDPAELTFDSATPGFRRAIGHMPLARTAFLAMAPRPIADGPVTEDELEGYRSWEQAKGGYFGG